jgi:tetratricopeptide (TPR) repeat protein
LTSHHLIAGEQYEHAAFIYTKYLVKNDKSKIDEAAKILEKVSNDQINSTFAKACVAAGRYQEAAKAYERAKDMDKVAIFACAFLTTITFAITSSQVIELKIRHLDQVQQAFDLIRQFPSSQGALLVAEYCMESKDYRGAIGNCTTVNDNRMSYLLFIGQSFFCWRTSQTMLSNSLKRIIWLRRIPQ